MRRSFFVAVMVLLMAAPGCGRNQDSERHENEGGTKPDAGIQSDSSLPDKIASSAGSSPPPSPGPEQKVSRAAPGSKDFRSQVVTALATRLSQVAAASRYSVATYLGTNPSPVATGEGVADYKANQFWLTLVAERPGGEKFNAEIVIAGSTMYPGEPGSDSRAWPQQSFNPDEIPLMVPDIELLEGTNQWPRPADDKDSRLKVFDAMVSRVDFVGDEQLRTSPVRHFKVELNRDLAASKLPAELASMAGNGVQEIEIWIDSQGRQRKLLTKARYYELWDFDSVADSQLPKARLPG